MLELRKQISFYVPASEWRELTAEAAARRVSIAELCRLIVAERKKSPDGLQPAGR